MPRQKPALKRIAALVAAIAAAGPAAGQYGASWATGDTAITTLGFAGAGPPPVRADRSPEEMARLFKAACLDTGGREEAIDAAVAAGTLALVGTDFAVAATKKRPAFRLRLWSGPGVVVARTDGFDVVREPQCNATFHIVAVPTNAALAGGMARVLGAPPSNAAEAVRKNGKPDKRFVPLWTLSEGSNPAVIVNGIAMSGGRFSISQVLIAARPVATAVR